MTGRIGKLVAVCLAALVTSVGVAAATGVNIGVAPKKNNAAVRLCLNTKSGTLRQVTSGYLNDTQPVFEPEGKYLYYASDRAFDPVYGTFDNTFCAGMVGVTI